MSEPRDPRSEAEKARADLKRNEEMGLGPAESDDERIPSVTSETFGVRKTARTDDPVRRQDRDDPLPEAP